MAYEVNQFLIGSHLGDGCFIKKSEMHNTYIVFKHCISQLDWLKWKFDFLSKHGYIKKGKTIKEVSIKDGSVYPNHQKQYYFATISSKDFNFVKTLDESFMLCHFDQLAFVVWLLDDGNVYKKTIKIATGSKSETFAQALVNKINELYGTNGVLYKHPDYPVKNYIRFGSADYETIRDIVLKYVPSDLDIVIKKFGGNEK